MTDHVSGLPETPQEPHPTNQWRKMADAAEMLWVVLANVSGGDWKQQSTDWQEAAARWRDAYFEALKSGSGEPPPEPSAPKELRFSVGEIGEAARAVGCGIRITGNTLSLYRLGEPSASETKEATTTAKPLAISCASGAVNDLTASLTAGAPHEPSTPDPEIAAFQEWTAQGKGPSTTETKPDISLRDALEALTTACELDYYGGSTDTCSDDEGVAIAETPDGESHLKFGMIRRARALLDSVSAVARSGEGRGK